MQTDVDTNEFTPPEEHPWPTDLLVCAATWMEMRSWWPRDDERSRLGEGEMAYSLALSHFITGIGIPATLGNLLAQLQKCAPGAHSQYRDRRHISRQRPEYRRYSDWHIGSIRRRRL